MKLFNSTNNCYDYQRHYIYLSVQTLQLIFYFLKIFEFHIWKKNLQWNIIQLNIRIIPFYNYFYFST